MLTSDVLFMCVDLLVLPPAGLEYGNVSFKFCLFVVPSQVLQTFLQQEWDPQVGVLFSYSTFNFRKQLLKCCFINPKEVIMEGLSLRTIRYNRPCMMRYNIFTLIYRSVRLISVTTAPRHVITTGFISDLFEGFRFLCVSACIFPRLP